VTASAAPEFGTADAYAAILRALYPMPWAPALIPLCGSAPHAHRGECCGSPGKRPTEKRWTTCARERFERGESADLDALGRHLASGGNVALAVPPGVLVLDADSPEAVAALETMLADAPMQTTRRGAHFAMRAPAGLALTNTTHVELAPGVVVDIRAAGACIAVDPSTQASGAGYCWRRELPPSFDELPACPAELERMLRTALAKPRRAETSDTPDPVREGARNIALFRIGSAMRGRGEPERAILAELHRVNAERCVPPLPDREVETTAKSGARYEPEHEASATPPAPEWPRPLGAAAYHGLAGEFVRMHEPHTEADPAALLADFLVEFGNVVGRNAHFVAEADKHYTNLFVGLVGETAKGRKGSSHGQVRRRFAALDEEWSRGRVLSGLSSGEGLIWAARDPISQRQPIKNKGKVTGYQEVETDCGVDDKRLLAFEPEFASTLRVLSREGNTLSPLIRQAWDTGTLRSLTKNSPARATGAHVSILAHITNTELRRYLDRTEAANGLANRFLWIAVRRSKLLPEGGSLQDVDFSHFLWELREAWEFASSDIEAFLVGGGLFPTLRGAPRPVRRRHIARRGTDDALGTAVRVARPLARDSAGSPRGGARVLAARARLGALHFR